MMGPSSLLRGGLLAALPLLSLAATPQCNGDSNAGNAASSLNGFVPASKYCSSSFPPRSTSTVTVAGTVTMTSTVSTSVISSVSPTVTSTSTAPAVVATNTVSTTITNTVVVTATQFAKRAVFRYNGTTYTRGAVVPISLSPQSSLLNSISQGPSTFASSVCACLETVPVTTATNFNATTAISVTATSFSVAPSTTTVTSTPSATSVVTQTFTSTVTSTKVVTSTTSTASPTGGVRTQVPQCNNVNSDVAETGGCSNACYCDSRPGMTNGYCSRNVDCVDANNVAYPPCTSDADCPLSSVCDNSSFLTDSCGSAICVPYDRTTCPSSFGYGS